MATEHINGSAPREPFNVNFPNGRTIAIRDMTYLELKLACESFEKSMHLALNVQMQAQQNLLNAVRMHATLSFELDRRARLSKHL